MWRASTEVREKGSREGGRQAGTETNRQSSAIKLGRHPLTRSTCGIYTSTVRGGLERTGKGTDTGRQTGRDRQTNIARVE